jgi:hypothetical protein
MSVWVINDDEGNLKRVLCALAATRDSIVAFDFLLFDQSIPDILGISVKQTDGATPDIHANQNWHRDLVDLSARKLVELAISVFENSEPARRYSENEVLTMLKAGIQRNELDLARVKEGVLKKVESGPLSRVAKLQRMSKEIWTASKIAWDKFVQS